MSFPRYPAYKDSGVPWLGEIPTHWGVTQGRRLFHQKRDPAIGTDEQLSATQKYGVLPQTMFMELENQKVTLALGGLGNFKHIENGDFVISLRSFQGGIERSLYSGCVSPAYTVLRTIAPVDGGYWGYLLKSTPYVEALQSVTDGIRDGKTISYDQFGQIVLPMAPLSEQAAVAAFLDRETSKIDELVGEQRRLIELLTEKRQAAISHAVTKGLNPHAPMKPSGIEWLGDVPKHWSIPPLFLRYNQVLGKMLDHGKMTGAHSTPYLRNLDVRWDYINVEDLPVMDIAPHERERFTIRKGDLLMVEGRELGRSAIWHGDDGVIGFQKALHRLRPLDGTEYTRYFYYLMIFVNGTGAFVADQSPNEIPHLTGEELRKYRFPKPPYAEQVAITEYLDLMTERFDTLTAEAQHGVNLLQERRTALISAAVTGKIDVREITQ